MLLTTCPVIQNARSPAALVVITRTITGGAQGGEVPLENFSPLLEKCVGRSLKLLDILQKIWAPLRKLFARPGVPSWLRAWSSPRTYILQDQ